MDIGCHLPTQGPVATREALMRFCREAEARDIASLWVSDHVVFPRRRAASIRAAASRTRPTRRISSPSPCSRRPRWSTERARLGSSVFILGHRHPVVMAKMLTTIDALSNGRLICGVGVGWWEEELTTLGVPFKQRGRHADEILKIFKTLWTVGSSDVRRRVLPLRRPRLPAEARAEAASADLGRRQQSRRVPSRRRPTATAGTRRTCSPTSCARASTSCAPPPTRRSGRSTRSSSRCALRNNGPAQGRRARRSSTCSARTRRRGSPTSCSTSAATA